MIGQGKHPTLACLYLTYLIPTNRDTDILEAVSGFHERKYHTEMCSSVHTGPPENAGINNPLPAKWFFNKPASISSNRIWFKPTPHRITLFFKLIIRDQLENWQNITDLPDCTIYCCELLKRGQINKVLIFTYSLIRDNIHIDDCQQDRILLENCVRRKEIFRL